jgi:hypothetical protein
MLTAIIGLTFAIDDAGQIALALTVPLETSSPIRPAMRFAVLGTRLIVTVR